MGRQYSPAYFLHVDDAEHIEKALGAYRDVHGHRYLRWKPDSLEFLTAGTLLTVADEGVQLVDDSLVLPYKKRDHIVLLGECLDQEGSTQTSL